MNFRNLSSSIYSCKIVYVIIVLMVLSCSDENQITGPVQVTSISPAKGPKNTELTITGKNFSMVPAENEVTINGKPVEVIKSIPTKLIVAIPAALGTGPVVVRTKSIEAENKPEFNYLWTVSTVAGTGEAGFLDGPGSLAKFDSPRGIAFDKNDNLLIADRKNSRIRKLSGDNKVTTITTTAYPPIDLAVDNDGTIFFADGDVQKFANGEITALVLHPDYFSSVSLDKNGNLIMYHISDTGGAYLSGTGRKNITLGSLAYSQLGFISVPKKAVIDDEGNLYIPFNNSIQKINSEGGKSTFASGGLNVPSSMVFDADFNLYVTDTFNHSIKKVTPSGIIILVAGGGADGNGFKDGPLDGARFDSPQGIAINKNGIIYISDTGNHRIRKID
jgi:hypothetical protein